MRRFTVQVCGYVPGGPMKRVPLNLSMIRSKNPGEGPDWVLFSDLTADEAEQLSKDVAVSILVDWAKMQCVKKRLDHLLLGSSDGVEPPGLRSLGSQGQD